MTNNRPEINTCASRKRKRSECDKPTRSFAQEKIQARIAELEKIPVGEYTNEQEKELNKFQKKLSHLQKNQITAKNSRKRKKDTIANLEDQTINLQKEIQILKIRHASLTKENKLLNDEISFLIPLIHNATRNQRLNRHFSAKDENVISIPNQFVEPPAIDPLSIVDTQTIPPDIETQNQTNLLQDFSQFYIPFDEVHFLENLASSSSENMFPTSIPEVIDFRDNSALRSNSIFSQPSVTLALPDVSSSKNHKLT